MPCSPPKTVKDVWHQWKMLLQMPPLSQSQPLSQHQLRLRPLQARWANVAHVIADPLDQLVLRVPMVMMVLMVCLAPQEIVVLQLHQPQNSPAKEENHAHANLAQLAMLDLVDQKDPMDQLEMLVPLVLLDNPEDLELLDHLDPLVLLETLEVLEHLAMLEKSLDQNLAQQDPLVPLANLALPALPVNLAVPARMAAPAQLVDQAMVAPLAVPAKLAELVLLETLARTVPLAVANIAHLLVWLLVIKHQIPNQTSHRNCDKTMSYDFKIFQ